MKRITVKNSSGYTTWMIELPDNEVDAYIHHETVANNYWGKPGEYYYEIIDITQELADKEASEHTEKDAVLKLKNRLATYRKTIEAVDISGINSIDTCKVQLTALQGLIVDFITDVEKAFLRTLK